MAQFDVGGFPEELGDEGDRDADFPCHVRFDLRAVVSIVGEDDVEQGETELFKEVRVVVLVLCLDGLDNR